LPSYDVKKAVTSELVTDKQSRGPRSTWSLSTTSLEVVACEFGAAAGTLERWREDAQSRTALGQAW